VAFAPCLGSAALSLADVPREWASASCARPDSEEARA
jgi:hypothetical protein